MRKKILLFIITFLFISAFFYVKASQFNNEIKPSTYVPENDFNKNKSIVQSSTSIVQKDPITKKVIYNGPAEGKRVALTFDDGPDITVTSKILEILKKNSVKATFFIVGTQAKAHKKMVRQIVEEKHIIGNHSWSHPNFNKLKMEEALKQVNDTQELLKDITGYWPSLFRSPYGNLNKDEETEISKMGMSIINWSVDTRDWSGLKSNDILKLVRKELKPGGIILFHCAGGTKENTIQALTVLIPELRKKGYTFVTVPELLQN